jgi:glycosyltransferase involved in cell wall biosynthesis
MKTTNVELHILGLGTEEDRKKWFKYAEEQGVKDKVIFDQSLAGVEKVLEWNDGIDIAILPSRSEGLPRCIVESMSRACPCILSDAAGMPELIEHKWLHKPGDAEKLAKLIDSMCNSNKNMEDAAKKNFDRSKDFAQKVLTSRRNAFLNRFKEYASSL